MVSTYPAATLIRRQTQIRPPFLQKILTPRISIGAEIVVNAPTLAAMTQSTGGRKESWYVFRILVDRLLLVAQLLRGHCPASQLLAINAAPIEVRTANPCRSVHLVGFQAQVMAPLQVLLLAGGKWKEARSVLQSTAPTTAHTTLQIGHSLSELNLKENTN